MRTTQILLALAIGLTALFGLTSCTQEQIDRAAQISAEADARLTAADQAMALAQQAIDQGKALAEQVGSIRAEQVVAQAQQALVAAGAAREVAKVAADTGHAALASAKAAQAAGGSTIDVIVAGITVAVPALGALAVALRKLAETARDFRQTVAGVEKAKETMPADQVAKLHAALAAEQDAGTKERVSLVKATLAGLALCFLTLASAGASELGLGPSPLAGSASVDSAAITDGAILNADVNAAAAIAGTKVAPAFGAQNVTSTNTGAASFSTAGGYTSTVATGTAPFTSTSTTVCPNLNAAQLNGTTWTAPGAIGGGTPSTGAFTTLSTTGAVTSTLADGSAPFVLTSTTKSTNLNADLLDGTDWRAPGAIGGTTPSTGAFTTVSATGAITSTLATGTAPFTIASTTVVGNLNVSQLLGSTWAIPGSIGATTPAAGAFTTLTSSSTATFSGTTKVNGNQPILQLDETSAGDNNGRIIRFLNSTAGTWLNWQIASNYNVGGGFEITPSTAANGSTYSTPSIQISAAGNTTVNGGLSAAATTDSTSATTGCFVASGGIGVPKNIVGKQGLGWGVTSTVTAAGTTTITTASTAVQVFTGSTTQTVTLPAANAFGAGIGYVLFIKNVSSGNVTVNRAGSDTINDASSVTTKVVATFTALRLVSDGVSAWEVL